jgi:hypothetical protein
LPPGGKASTVFDDGPKKRRPMKRDPGSRAAKRGHRIRCAYCHQEIRGMPIEKNGYLYDSEEHARLDEEHAPKS